MNIKKRPRDHEDGFSFDIHQLEFVSNRKLQESLKCPICLCIMFRPIYLKTCQHSFCESCFERLFTNGSDATGIERKERINCPTCRAEVTPSDKTISINHGVLLDMLEAKCPSDLCFWTGHYKDVSKHLKAECNILYLCDCNRVIQRDDDKHRDSCCMVLVQCKCGANIHRKDLARHVSSRCPEEIVSCKYVEDGCVWSGKRAELKDVHTKNCKIGRLHNRLEHAQKRNLSLESELIVFQTLRCSESLITCGYFDDQNPARRDIVRSLMTTYLKLDYPVQYGGDGGDPTSSDRIEAGMASDSLFEFSRTSPSLWHAVIVEIDPDRGIMCITLGKKKNRFFVVRKTPEENKQVKISKHMGKVVIDFPSIDKRSTAFVIYAYRGWLSSEDNVEEPFVIVPNVTHYTRITMKGGTKEITDTLFNQVSQFFNN